MNKTDVQAIYTAFDIHRRVAVLAAMWTAFDPFGAVVYFLREVEGNAWDLRRAVEDTKDMGCWDFTKMGGHPLRKIKDGCDNYETFRNHIKGIEGAIRRLVRNPYFVKADLKMYVDRLRESLFQLRDFG